MVQVGYEEGEKCTSRISSVLQFPHAHQSYKCICGLLHVKPATRTIGAVTVFLISMNFFWAILTYSDTKDVSVGSAILYSTYVLAVIVSTFALFFGVSRKRYKLLLPFIFIQIMTALASIVFLIIVIIFAVCNTWHLIHPHVRLLLEDSTNQSKKQNVIFIFSFLKCHNINQRKEKKTVKKHRFRYL
ncbi:unnamed protein product [Brugia pahangi]|uniref:Vesicle transport protein n=1 Tax=Brugia pahangi TaxID=6280 RepID=A0A0N4TDX6_BRUPA|nr:unnamed protein product [Brugia pahangi]